MAQKEQERTPAPRSCGGSPCTALIKRIGEDLAPFIEFLAYMFRWRDFLAASDEIHAQLERDFQQVYARRPGSANTRRRSPTCCGEASTALTEPSRAGNSQRWAVCSQGTVQAGAKL
jgi:hypothetical protein